MKYVLVSDGSSDKALIPIINYLLVTTFNLKNIIGERADLHKLIRPPKKLEDKIIKAIDLYETDLVFIHRDAEKFSIEKRDEEINKAISLVNQKLTSDGKYVKVIPIRMTEAWLLIDEKAIKQASGNPSSPVILDLPDINKIEKIPDPKQLLIEKIKLASGRKGRDLKKLNTHFCIQLVSQYMTDFKPLDNLPGFQYLKKQIDELHTLLKIIEN